MFRDVAECDDVCAAPFPPHVRFGSHPTDHTTLNAVALGGVIETIKVGGYSFVTINALS